MNSSPRISNQEIKEFMNRSDSETDDSKRCRGIIGQLINDKESDLYLEFGDGNILVLTAEDNKLILSKQNGKGVIGKKGSISDGDTYTPSGSDVVMKFKNIESLLILKDAIRDIETSILGL